MKPSSGAPGTDRRVWVRFLQSYSRSRRGCGKVEIRWGVPDFQAHWEVRSRDFSRERLFISLPRYGAPLYAAGELAREVNDDHNQDG